MYILAPSILSADFMHLGDQLSQLKQCGVKMLHYDVMDGKFVPPISYGEVILKACKAQEKFIYDVHLMIEKPYVNIESFAAAGADYITVHTEACFDVHRVIQKIHDCGCKAGISIKPGTSVSSIFPYLEEVDLVLIMTVEPGYGGQEFMPEMLNKIKALRKEITKRNLNIDIQVDGGINLDTVQQVMEAGANIFVSGSGVFKGDIKTNINEFYKIIGE